MSPRYYPSESKKPQTSTHLLSKTQMDYPNYAKGGVSQPFVPQTYDKVQEISVLENIERKSNM